MSSRLGQICFRSRSWLPLPWLIAWIWSADAELPFWVLGILCGLCGLGLRMWAVSWIGSASRRRDDGRPELCVEGPYRIVRNPLYIGNIIVYMGLCLAGGSLGLAVGVGMYTATYYHFIVSYEEDNWSEDEQYRAYVQRIPRWFPKRIEAAAFQWGAILPALRSERSSVLAWVLCLLLLWMKEMAFFGRTI